MKPTSLPPSFARRTRRTTLLLACLGLWAGTCGAAQAEAPTGAAQAARPATPPPPDLSRVSAQPTARGKPEAGKAPQVVAADAEPATRSSTTTTTSQYGPGEPVVQRSVIEDDGSRIEETRVRGQLQRITVTPKVGSKASYEILTGDGSGSEASRSTAGKRVWNVFQF